MNVNSPANKLFKIGVYMAKADFKPFVPADSDLAELTVKAVVLGVMMAVILGAANAYLGMKAGLTL